MYFDKTISLKQKAASLVNMELLTQYNYQQNYNYSIVS